MIFSSIIKRTVIRCCRYYVSGSKRKVIAIEGNIGAGKTVCLNYLRGIKGIDVQEEPINNWRDVGGVNALDLLYMDPPRWSFLFNQYALLSRLNIYQQPISGEMKVIERSVFSTFYIFVQNNFNNKELNSIEYKVLHDWFKFVITSLNISIDHFVYLRTDPEICLKRVKKRGRAEEQSMTLDFLVKIHNLHEDLFVENAHKLNASQVHVVDASKEMQDLKLIYEDIVSSAVAAK